MIEKTLWLALSEILPNLFPVEIPQEHEGPALVYFRAATKPTNTLRGTNRRHDNGDFQIEIRADDYFTAAEISEKVIDKMGTVFGPNSVLIYNADDKNEPAVSGKFRRTLVFSLREIREGP